MNNENEEPFLNGDKTEIERDNKGQFTEGNKGGPGRPYGAKSHLKQLEEAIEKEAEKAGITYWERLAQWCFVNPKLAVAILKKFIPDKSYMEVKGDLKQPTNIDLSGLSTEELRALAYGYKIKDKPTKKQKEIKERKT